jgi:DNA-binding helix-hairpin-helix protein with protein kinase domain
MSPFPSVVQTSLGRTLHLTKQIGQGGEGAIYETQEQNDIALKLYWPTKAESRRDKIAVMASAQLYKRAPFVVFPIDTVFSPSGAFIGFVMRKVGGGKPVHMLFSPASRKLEFTFATYKFLVRVAVNIARAVASVHATLCVIGDVNQSGFLVSEEATSTLIDCDSFQIVAATRKHLCQVGTPEYTPPELQGVRFDRVERTPNHDNFGLAVLLFQILFMGRHPFSGRYQGTGDMPLERAIGEYRFAYSAQKTLTKMEPPPAAPLLTDFPSYIGQAFETAFGRAGLNDRPTASSWVSLLEWLEKELVECAADSKHHHVRSKPCPWCRMEQSILGFVAFVSPHIAVFVPTHIDLSQITAVLSGIRDPGPAPTLQTLIIVPNNLRPVPPPRGLISFLTVRAYVGIVTSSAGAILSFLGNPVEYIGLFVLAVGLLFNIGAPKEVRRLRKARSQAETTWQNVQEVSGQQSSDRTFTEIRSKIDGLVRSLSELPDEERRELQVLEQKKIEIQLAQYLERLLIAKAKIGKLGRLGRPRLHPSVSRQRRISISRSFLQFKASGRPWSLR